jgi:oligoendopeptidase F
METVTLAAARYQLGRWDLSELLVNPSDESVAARLAEVESLVQALEAWRPLLSSAMPVTDLVTMLRATEEVTEKMWALGAYGSLWFSSDTQSTAALTFRNRVQQAFTGLQNRLIFLELWWKGLSEPEAERFYAGMDGEADYLHYLRDQRRLKPHTLEERAEQIINLKDADGIGGVLTAYSILTNRLEFELDGPQGRQKLTRDELVSHVHAVDSATRHAAYQEFFRVFAAEATVLGQLYVHRVRDWHNENVGLRGYASAESVRNVANDIPDAAVDALLEVCREQAPLFQRYFRAKARWLGMEKLHRYDLYAPTAASQRTIPFDEAVELVVETFRSFHPRFADEAERVFAARHVDSEVRKGKRGGAFCSTVLPRLAPWVLVNYTGRVRDVATLAHELGHAVHSLMAAHHSILTQHPSLPLAETASVFAEILLTERLLGEERDPLARRDLLGAALDDIYATVMRQAFFVLFERAAHRGILEGRSTEEISELYLANLREQFGDAVEVPDTLRHEWVAIPHLYQTPFYCYAYSFGQLLVLALYRRYRETGEEFKAGYLRLLAHGGAARPVDILAEAGVDPGDREFWRGGFEVIRGMVEEAEALGSGPKTV